MKRNQKDLKKQIQEIFENVYGLKVSNTVKKERVKRIPKKDFINIIHALLSFEDKMNTLAENGVILDPVVEDLFDVIQTLLETNFNSLQIELINKYVFETYQQILEDSNLVSVVEIKIKDGANEICNFQTPEDVYEVIKKCYTKS